MTKRKRRQLFHPFMFRGFTHPQVGNSKESAPEKTNQADDNSPVAITTPSQYPTRHFHNPFGQLFAPYARIQPDPIAVPKTKLPVDPLFGFESEENILPINETININAIHTYTKEIISTLHTIDKSLELVIKGLAILDNYNINLASLSGKKSVSGGSPILKLATDFMKKINVNQLEQTINLLQSPMVVELLTNGLNFDDDESK